MVQISINEKTREDIKKNICEGGFQRKGAEGD